MKELLQELKNTYGEEAEFRDGQEEAIQEVLNGKRLLVVQKTGWGKSLVYFLATRMIRKRTQAVTLIISPLLALMNNQIVSADKLGLQVETINSENMDNWESVIERLEKNRIDALIVSPERLANEEFQELFRTGILRIGLFVVDEAHCISDWGHDFRPDYRRIVDVIRRLPSNIPVLATTATANDRVIKDIKEQLGEDIIVSRGSLMRESLQLQVIRLTTKEERLAWILDHIMELPGTGIIYCLTVSDCQLVYKWLCTNGIPSRCYYADLKNDGTEDKQTIVDLFMTNQIKVLAATVAFGMGFDKPDIGFVIHFQKPGNLVAYYQQIGRAGRGISRALAILLSGGEDNRINNYFIESAFPTEDLMEEVMSAVRENPDPGLKQSDFEKLINMKPSKIKACLKYLVVEGAIYKDGAYYRPAARFWKPDMEKSREITAIRRNELEQMTDFAGTGSCYMKYIAGVLDDSRAKACGTCSNCLNRPIVSEELRQNTLLKAQSFIKEDFHEIDPRKQWPSGVLVDGKNRIPKEFLCETGRVLSYYGDAGWGRLVAEGKYRDHHFDDQLVEAAAGLLTDFVEEHEIRWVTGIPSLRRPALVPEFARRLAAQLHLNYAQVIEKVKDTRCQKELNTSFLQYENVKDSFEVKQAFSENVLLVDDMVDSRWTFTVCGYKLRESGSGKVFPFALASSAGRDGR
ncbi:ATP-dependent RNA helicase DbpA [Eubacterium plexicaudatum ASF492]|uniref:ATP-dependent DNA helicase RecQ n=1 Tax=Eubacterium plexicaudatum ASF492 TaxID=1235802 RepID=N2A2B4_9FIRM|nr:ATP-dependent RNA helicase DbpA [Eubacterium plexicaudatum ASF492]